MYASKFLSRCGSNNRYDFSSSFKRENNIDWRKDNKRLKSMAHKTPSTLNPSIRLSANKMIIALIIKRKRPKVKMVTGKVSMTRIGFTMKFKRLSTIATIIAVI